MRLRLTSLLLFTLPAAAQAADPILFVHGNGDSAALWTTVIWRFESNGWDPARLFAIDFTSPTARRDDKVPEPNRSSTIDQTSELSAMVTRVLLTTGAKKVVLVGSSRGGNAMRNYIRNAGGQATVSHAILCATPNHGVYAGPLNPGNEFNGQAPFLKALNSGGEVLPGVAFFTLRSDRNDLYAQPEGSVLGMKGKPTGVTYDGPALEGATNIVLPSLDHREVAFHPKAFREMYRFLTGSDPATLDIRPEEHPVLSGMVSGFENGAPTNRPLAGIQVAVYEVDPATGRRKGTAVREIVTAADGQWGPLTADPKAYYEFELRDARHSVHIYRTPFPRSSRYVHLRFRPPESQQPGSTVVLSRPRGYLGKGRDVIEIDGKEPADVPAGVPVRDSAMARFTDADSRSVPVRLNDEKLTVRTFPAEPSHLVVAEFHHD
ncbi:MAG: alpha/beta fold hydrolase [Acidobacteria bacterium]|nr:alpha/beta fold hydrolase [Acidobacteriota bacterium]